MHASTDEVQSETVGCVSNVTFPCAALADAATGRIPVYYGAADSHTALAFSQAEDLLDDLKSDSEF